MKKNIFITLVCLIFLASTAQAKCTCQTCNCKVQKTCDYSIINNNANSFNTFSEQIKKERLAISNALALTEEQTKCKIEITKKYSAELNCKLKEFYETNCKLKALNASKASKEAIAEQEENLKRIKNEISDIVSNENKEFKKILDHQQRSKLRMIQKLERKAVKSCKNQKDYYKSNPKMRPFGIPNKPNCNCTK